MSRLFHPTCGDFTACGKCSHSPLNRPRPRVPGDSWLRSNIHCMPTQMPRNGTLQEIDCAIAACNPECANAAVEPKWPTPGRMTLAALATCDGSEVTAHS